MSVSECMSGVSLDEELTLGDFDDFAADANLVGGFGVLGAEIEE